MKQILKLIIISLALNIQAKAQNKAGMLDNSFGVNGKILTSSSTGYLNCNAAAAQSDGSIIATGSISSVDIDGFLQ